MSTPISTNGGESPAPSAARDLRDRWWFRVGAIAAALGLAAVAARGCGSSNRDVSQEQAVELAREAATFTPERHQIRFLQQGIPAHPFWAVSLYDVGPGGLPVHTEVYLVDASSGEVTRQK
ncbi:MAG TPA: hypothetical protein VJ689_10980 [Gaiellaceae bacterium]|nr:hypothetical protein [Gaiellaceae bacterium]